MLDFFYLGIIGLLSFIIFILIRKINAIKKMHEQRLFELNLKLKQLVSDNEKDQQKMKLDNNFSKVLSSANLHLSEEIFDLQMNVFRKIKEN